MPETASTGKPVMMRRIINYAFTELYLRHSNPHLFSQRVRQMDASDFFLLCSLRTGLLSLRNTAAKDLGDRVRGLHTTALRSKKL